MCLKYNTREQSWIRRESLSLSFIFGPTVSRPVRGLRPDLYYLCDSCGLVLVGRPLWREVGSVFCMCCWPLPAQYFSGPSPLGLETIFYCLRFETSFSSPPTTRRVTVEVFDSTSIRVIPSNLSYNRSSLYRFLTDHTENTSHVIAISAVHWRAGCCLAKIYNFRPIVACAYRGVFIEPLGLAMLRANPSQYVILIVSMIVKLYS
jgi:hypothetical protein